VEARHTNSYAGADFVRAEARPVRRMGVIVARQLVVVSWGSRCMIPWSWVSSEMPWKS
jgi:hypothetical protein